MSFGRPLGAPQSLLARLIEEESARQPAAEDQPPVGDPAVEETPPDKPTAEEIENRYWKQTLGTTDLAARGYRSYWD